jgi:hypothetical protein
MKKVCFFFLTISSIFSCSKEGDDLLSNDVTIDLNGVTYHVNDKFSSNENCNTIFILFQPSNAFPYVLDLTLSKKGDIISAKIADQTKNYESLAFNPTETFKITSFQYDSVNTSLAMNFEGTLFSSKKTTYTTIKGVINKLNIKPTTCSSILARIEAVLETNNGNTERIYSTSGVAEFDSKTYRQYYYSNNGYRFVLESKTNFNTTKSGVYSITSDPNSSIKVKFQKYIGSTGDNISITYNSNEWTDFRTEGTVDIGQPLTLNGTKGIAGKLNITAFDENNQTIYHIKNGNFILANINN